MRRPLTALAGVTVIGAVLRFADLGDKSLWIDEAFSISTSARALPDLWRTTVDLDHHPPLYYVLLRAWLVLGDGEAAVRSLSAVLGVLTLPVVFLVGRRLGGAGLGLASSALVAVSPLQVAYAQQARMYALLTLCAALSLHFGLLVLDAPERRGGVAATARQRRLAWAGFVVSTTLTMLSHNTGVLLTAALALLVAVVAVRSALPGGRGLDLRHRLDGVVGVGTGVCAALLLWSPWLPWFVQQARSVDERFWLEPPTTAAVLAHAHDLVNAHGPQALRDPVLVAFAGLVALGVRRLRSRPEAALGLVLLVVVPVAVELLVSLRRPVFFAQTLVWTAVPLCVLAAAGVLALRRRPVVVALAAGVLALEAVALARYYADEGKEDWRSAVQHVADRVEAGDLVLFSAAWAQLPFDYYYERSDGPPVVRYGLPADVFASERLEAEVTPAVGGRLDELTAGQRVVWLVLSHDWYTDPEGLVVGHLSRSFVAVERRPFRQVEVVRLEAVP